ncbi:hypothetical protein BCF11_0130 [Collimonas sp. PA-H2]|nr:hypothetical protein BCF11_0130 [Collimonas sp. PA-H2]
MLPPLWGQVKLDYLPIVFHLANGKTIPECHVPGGALLRRYKTAPIELDPYQ